MSPSAAVAPLVMLSIASPREDTSKPVIWSSESTAAPVILSNAPPNSDEESPPDPREPTTVSTSSLEALPISVELKPASSRFATDVEVILLRTVSVAVDPDSAEALGSLSGRRVYVRVLRAPVDCYGRGQFLDPRSGRAECDVDC